MPPKRSHSRSASKATTITDTPSPTQSSRSSPTATKRPRKKADSVSTPRKSTRSHHAHHHPHHTYYKRMSTSLRSFALLVPLSFSITAAFNAISSSWRADSPELAPIARSLSEPWQIVGLLGLRTLQLAVLRSTGLDALDATLLSFLAHAPHLYLLNTFYLISLPNILVSAIATAASVYIPFRLFKKPTAPKTSATSVPLSSLLTISLLGAGLYAVPLLVSYYTRFLPVFMAVHFDGLRTLAPAHSSTLLSTALFTLPIGLGVARFLFAPSIEAARPAAVVKEVDQLVFDPVTASFYETFSYNIYFWRRYGAPARVLMLRTAFLALTTALHTVTQSYVEIAGVDLAGALGWASVWAFSTALTGAVFGWVGSLW